MKQSEIERLNEVIAADYGNMSGLVVLSGGETVLEEYFGGAEKDDAMHVFSVTKSITSALIGIAIDKGYIGSVKQKVLDFFPNYRIKRGEKTLQQVEIKDILTMTAPYKYKSAPYTKYFSSDDWVTASLDLLGGKGTIGEFRYAPLIGPDVLSGIIKSATGKSPREFAEENLFAPLSVCVPRDIIFKSKGEQLLWYKNYKQSSGWVSDPCGNSTAAWGVVISATELAKIGELYRNGGEYNGVRVISEEWMRESTSKHSDWNGLSYGYLWWLMEKDNMFAALGDGGNALFVLPKKKAVVAITSRFKPLAKDRIEFVEKYIAPLL